FQAEDGIRDRNVTGVQTCALPISRKRCWRKDWVLEFDIKGLFDNINHDILLKMVEKHTKEKWVLLYIRRWLITPFQMNDGDIVRSEERRVGKECRSQWWRYGLEKQ